MDALSRLKKSLKDNEMTVDLEDLCGDVKGIEADSDFVAFLGINWRKKEVRAWWSNLSD